MNKIHNLIFVVFLSLQSSTIWSQLIDPKEIIWEQKTINFGVVNVSEGPKVATFRFTNRSKQPLIISQVTTECGCTSPQFPKKPILPGERAEIKATFQSARVYGTFEKRLRVLANFIGNQEISLAIKGSVNHDSRVPYTKEESVSQNKKAGHFRLKSHFILFGDVDKNQQKNASLIYTNNGTYDLQLINIERLPKTISWYGPKEPTRPGEKDTIHFKFDPSKTDESWGFQNGKFFLYTTDNFNPRKEIIYNAWVKKDFSHLRKKELKKAPKIIIDSKTVELGKLKAGLKKSGSFKLTNVGKTDLEIYYIKTDCSCTIVKKPKRTIPPKSSATFWVEFDSVFKKGKQSKPLTLYTNSPSMPVLKIMVKAEVTDYLSHDY